MESMSGTNSNGKRRLGRRGALAAVGALGGTAAGLGGVLSETQPAYAEPTGSAVLHLGQGNTASAPTVLESQNATATLDLGNSGSGAALLVDSGFVQLSEVPTRGFVDAGSELFDVRAYGPVKPDVSAALQQALQAAAGAGGGVVYLPSGRYQISEPIDLQGGVTLRGAGPAATVLTAAPTVLDSVLSLVDTSDVVVEDLSIDMTGATIDDNTQGIAIDIQAAKADVLRTVIRNVAITKAPIHAIQAVTSSHLPPSSNTLQLELDLVDVIVTHCGPPGETSPAVGHGIFVTNATRLACRGVRVNRNAASGLVINGCTDVEVVGCEAQYNGNHGISTSSALGASRLSIVGNDCSFNGTKKIGLGDGIVISKAVTDFAVVGNVCCNNYGINLDVDVTAPDYTQLIEAHGVVSGNVCNGSVALHGLSVNHAVGVTIVGNTAVGNKLSGMTLPDCQSLNVAGNVIGDNGNGGISINQIPNHPAGTGGHLIGPNTYFGNGGAGDVWAAPGIPYSRVDADQVVLAGGASVTVSNGRGAGSAAPDVTAAPASNGVRGTISFGSGSAPEPGEQAVVTYPQPLPAPGFVQLTSGNDATARLLPYVAASTESGFTVAVASSPSAGQPAETYTLTYQVIG